MSETREEYLLRRGEELRAKSRRFREVQNPPHPRAEVLELGLVVETIRQTSNEEIRLTWIDTPERPPSFGLRLWVDKAWGFEPMKGVGISIRLKDLGTFADGVAQVMDLAAEYLQRQERQRRGG